MKILHIISSGGMYGAEAVILNLSRGLAEQGHESIVGVFDNVGNSNLQLYQAAQSAGIEAHKILCQGQVDRQVLRRIRRLVRETGAEVVHAHGYKADIYSYFALRGGITPIVSTCHSWYDNDLLVTLYGMADRLVLRRFAGVVAVSDAVKSGLLKAGVHEERVRLIGNGIDTRPYDRDGEPSQEAEGLCVGLVGRLAQEKGIDIFLQAAARVLQEYPSARFVVAGDGPDRQSLEALIDQLGIRVSVTMLGQQKDMLEFYRSLQIMVSSSRQEGLPIALLEGMACGLPLVATAVGDVPKIIRNDDTGVLVPAEDVAALAAGILDLLHDSARRDRLGRSARRLVAEEFSAASMTAEYLKLYEGVCCGGVKQSLVRKSAA